MTDFKDWWNFPEESAAGASRTIDALEAKFRGLMQEALDESTIEDDAAARRAAADHAYGEMMDRLSDLLSRYSSE